MVNSRLRIAVLEDSPADQELYKFWLSAAGHGVHAYATGADMLRAASRESFDLYLLDWQLPDTTGIAVLGALRRERNIAQPVLFATGRDSEEDVVSALEAGADDYMIKPLRRMEVVARIQALCRRAGGQNGGERLEFGAYVFDRATNSVQVNGADVVLTDKEFDLAAFFFQRAGMLISRAHLQEAVWGYKGEVPSRAIDTHVSNLRKKLLLTDGNGYRMQSVYSFGYRLEAVGAALTAAV
jgi:two-component system, OmpR family, response regulator RegX3